MILCLAMGLLSGCSVTAEMSGADISGTYTTVRFSGDQVNISGSGAMLDSGEVVIAEAGTYVLSGTSANSRVIVKAADTADVILVLDGLELTNPLDEAIYFKTCGSATVLLEAGTENSLISGEEPSEDNEESLTITDENEDASGAVLRARCAMTISGEGSLSVGGYINNGIAADGGLTVTGGTYDIYAVNDGLKSDLDITVTGGVFSIHTECDGVQAGGTLDISGGDFTVFTGAGAEGADMKVSDSLMMGNMGGGMGGNRGNRGSASKDGSSEASGEALAEADTASTEMMQADEADTASDSLTRQAEAAETNETKDASASGEMSASREMSMSGGGMDDWMDFWDTDSTDTPSRKGLKATEAIVISGGNITIDAEDDAIHCDGSVTITGGKLTLSSGDDGIHGETILDISGGELEILLCYEGLEAKAIYISDGYMNITAIDDGMNAGGSSGEMMGGMGGMRGSSRKASSEVDIAAFLEAFSEADIAAFLESFSEADIAAFLESFSEADIAAFLEAFSEADIAAFLEAFSEADITAFLEASGEPNTTASQEAYTESDASASQEAETETIETVVRITGGTIIVNSGGDGLDSNASMYIEGGIIFVSGPSSNWDSPIDYGEGSSEFVITGGFLMAAGYSGMFESPDTTDASQSSIYYIQSGYAPDNAVTALKAADGTVLAEYAFANSYNGVLISTPDMAAGETYTLTIDGVDTVIEMTAAQYSNRGGSGEMGGMGGMGGRR